MALLQTPPSHSAPHHTAPRLQDKGPAQHHLSPSPQVQQSRHHQALFSQQTSQLRTKMGQSHPARDAQPAARTQGRRPRPCPWIHTNTTHHCHNSPGRNTNQLSSTNTTTQPIQMLVTTHPQRGYNPSMPPSSPLHRPHPDTTARHAPPPHPPDNHRSPPPGWGPKPEGNIGGRPSQHTKDWAPRQPHSPTPGGVPACRPHTLLHDIPSRRPSTKAKPHPNHTVQPRSPSLNPLLPQPMAGH
ncbi:hypothetical protein CRENBAI_021897 [Crenichthys baileyi]|uniref:Uncharacterized protein n=1 Tax=Crenichthys baileyi TaxID=28760 RepID=A0AAV9SR50_9TELE